MAGIVRHVGRSSEEILRDNSRLHPSSGYGTPLVPPAQPATVAEKEVAASAERSSEKDSDAQHAADLEAYRQMAAGSVNPKDAYGDKKPDISLVPPVAIIKEARVMQLGAKKYGPYNWREKRVRARVYAAAAMRHIMQWQDGEEFDFESGESHLAHARACLGIVLDAQSIGIIDDDRPKKGAAGKEIRREQGTDKA